MLKWVSRTNSKPIGSNRSPNSTALQGFTIVELLVVIFVIAILAAITIATFSGVRNMAETTAIRSDLGTTSKEIVIDSITRTGGRHTDATFMPYLQMETKLANITFRYGDDTSYCIEATSKRDPSIKFYTSSSNDATATREGSCPDTFTEASIRCLAGKATLAVTARNTTSATVEMDITSAFSATETVTIEGGSSFFKGFTTRLNPTPAGIVTVHIKGQEPGTLPDVRYHAYQARNC